MLTSSRHSCPLYLPVTGDNVGNMNWAVAIVGAEVLFSGVYWIYGARHKYLKDESAVARDNSIPVLVGRTVDISHEVLEAKTVQEGKVG